MILRDRVAALENEVFTLRQERDMLRGWLVHDLRETIKTQSEHQQWKMDYIIRVFSARLNKLNVFDFSL